VSERAEEAFSRLRRGPWNDSPLGVPQEGFGGNGNIESQGWLSDGSVTADVIQANAVIAGKIDADAVTAREIAANTITAAEIAANTITAAQIAASTITSNEIAANTITAADIAANTITASEIAANTITASEIAANTITASEIAADAITTNELAADAVITENLLAGNVTSSKIELTISGKQFGANSGSAGAPGVYFDSDNDTGMYYASGIGFAVNGSSAMFLTGAITLSDNTVEPGTDNAYSMGSASFRWTEVWAVDGTINTSDARNKMDIEDAPLGLDFVRSLRPRTYRWRDTVDTQAQQEAAAGVDRSAMLREIAPHERRVEKIRKLQVEGKITDADADARISMARGAIGEIQRRYEAPIVAAKHARRPGRRVHYGLIAQEVKESLDAAGVDAAFWKQGPSGEQALAYTELIAPLIKAVHELSDRLEAAGL